LAAAIEKKHDLTVELIDGGGGIFDVKLGDKLIYSKHQTGRFPEHDEVLAEIEAQSS